MDDKKRQESDSSSSEKKRRSRSSKKEKKKHKSKKSKERKSQTKKDRKKSEKKHKHDKDKKKSEKTKEDKQSVKKDPITIEASKEQRVAKIREDRRRRSRSNSALRQIQKQIQANNPAAKANSLGYDKQDCFWDGFTWVPKTNLHDKVRDDKDKVMSQTSRMRRVQICNIPTGLTSRDLYAELSRFMNKNYLNDVGNPKPILTCNLNEKDRSCTLELSSVEEANRLLKLDDIKLLDEQCKILRLGESLYGQSINQSQLVQQAHNQAQAYAAAFLAMKALGFAKGQRAEDEILAQAGITSRIIKVGNFLNAAMAINLNKNEWDEMREDLLEGFSQFGHIEDDFFVKPYQHGLGAEAGSLFIIYSNKEEAQKTVVGMNGRTYNQRELKIVFINEQTYIRSYIPLKLKPPPQGDEKYDVDEYEYDSNNEEQEEYEQEQQNELNQQLVNAPQEGMQIEETNGQSEQQMAVEVAIENQVNDVLNQQTNEQDQMKQTDSSMDVPQMESEVMQQSQVQEIESL